MWNRLIWYKKTFFLCKFLHRKCFIWSISTGSKAELKKKYLKLTLSKGLRSDMPSASCSVLYLAMMSSILENETYKQGNYVMLHKQFNLIQMESVEIQE